MISLALLMEFRRFFARHHLLVDTLLRRTRPRQELSYGKIISTDPPYYDNIGYADLSDFFYLWLRRSLSSVFPDLFATVTVPKSEELVATPYRHGSKGKAELFFLGGMTEAIRQLAVQTHPSFPISIYYAFKQSEGRNDVGASSTGWETFLGAVIGAGARYIKHLANPNRDGHETSWNEHQCPSG